MLLIEHKIQQKLDIDDKCELAEECRSGVCTSNKCAYIADGGDCTNNMNCGKNSYCQTKVCTAYSKEKEECSNTKKCIPGLACASVGTDTTQSCVKRYSLADGTLTDNFYSCKSLYSFQIGTNIKETCGTTKSATSCNSSNQCEVTVSIGGTSDEKVKMDCYDGTCPGNEPNQKILATYIEEFTNTIDDY